MEISSLKNYEVYKEMKDDGELAPPRSYVLYLSPSDVEPGVGRGSMNGGSVFVTPHG